MIYLQRLSRRPAPRWAPVPGSNQIRTSAGGFAWVIDEWTRLRRLCLDDAVRMLSMRSRTTASWTCS